MRNKANIHKHSNPPQFGAPHISRRSFLGAIGAAGMVGASGFRSALADTPSKIVVYSTTLPPIQKKLTEAFTAKTGITVQSLRLVNNTLAQRFLAEQKAKQYICDVVTLGIDTFYEQLTSEGYLAPIDDVPGVATLNPEWRPGLRYVNIGYGPRSIAYNTRRVSQNETPKSWDDIIKPAFKDQIIMPDPRANDTIVSFLDMLHERYGDDFIRALGQQRPRLVPAIPQGVEMVISGEAKLMVPCLAMNLLQYEGTTAPISIIPTPSPTQGTEFFTGIAAHAPNLKGAREWLAFILGREGQEILCKDNCVSPLGSIPGSLPAPAELQKADIPKAMKKSDRLYNLLGLTA